MVWPARGSFVEVDSGLSEETTGYQRYSGDPTTVHGKLDYTFVRDANVVSAEVGSSQHSDHEPLWATVTVRDK